MTTETVAPDAATEIQASEVESQEVTAPEAESAETGETAAEAEKVEEKSPELVKLERELRKAQRINARLHQQVTAPRQEGQAEQPQGQDDPVSMAREIARIERFTEKSNELVTRGTKAHPDYLDSLKELASEVGPFVAPNGAPSKFMEVVLEVSDSPGDLMYHLGKNPDLAEELSSLSPIQLAKKLARIETAMAEAAKPQQSKAPKPLDPVKPKASGEKEPADMTMKEFTEWRLANGARRR